MFQTVVVPAQKRAGRKIAYLLLSSAAHALVLGSLFGASLWSVEEPPDPPIPVVFVNARALPPPPLGTSDGDDRPRRRPRPESPKPELRAPTQAAPALPLPDAPGLNAPPLEGGTDVSSGSEESKGPIGDPGGAKGGIGAPSGEGPVDGPYTLGSPGVDPPILLRRVDPEYPELARKLRLQGIVVVSAVIEADGRVDQLSVVHSASPLLEEPALKAIGGWRYRPATISGRAVRVVLDVRVDFSLH